MKRISRRDFFRAITVSAAAMSLAACGATATPTTAPAPPTATKPPSGGATAAAATPAAAATKPAAAATATTAAPAASGKTTTLQFPSWQQDEPGSSDWWKARIADYQKSHPGVTIEFTKVANADIAQKELAQFAAGTPPDIVHLPYLNMIQFADQGFLEPLDSYLAQTDVPKTWTPLQKGTMWKGATYAVLLLAYGYAMIYNQKMWSDAGQTPPKTGQDFVKAVKAITKKPDIFGYGTTTNPGFNLLVHTTTFMVGNGGRLTTDGKPSVNTPQAVDGMSQWVDILRSGASPTGMDTGPLRQLLTQGKVATYFDGPWGQGFIKTAAPDIQQNLKVTRMPFPKIFGGSSNSVSMPKNVSAERKALIWDFIKSLTTADAQKDYVLKYCVPATRNDLTIASTELHAACPLIDPWLEALQSPDLVDFYPFGLDTKTAQLQTIMSETAQYLITTQSASVKDELDKLQKKMEDLQKS